MTIPVRLLLSAAALAASCSPSPSAPEEVPPEPVSFDHRTSLSQPVAIEVELDGSPLRGASVQVLDTLEAPDDGRPSRSGVYYVGSTVEGGLARGLAQIPTAVARVDVVVQVAGASGPHSHPELAASWGPFAPSSRVTVDVAALSETRISLWRD